MKGEPVTLDDLLAALDSQDADRRSEAALRTSEFAEAAVGRLIRAARTVRTNPGTLAYALRAFNCSEHFDDMFALALEGNYEVQCHALAILHDQSFEVTADQLRVAGDRLGELVPREHLPPPDVELLRAELTAILRRFSAELEVL
jgi:hypothetical protein